MFSFKTLLPVAAVILAMYEQGCGSAEEKPKNLCTFTQNVPENKKPTVFTVRMDKREFNGEMTCPETNVVKSQLKLDVIDDDFNQKLSLIDEDVCTGLQKKFANNCLASCDIMACTRAFETLVKADVKNRKATNVFLQLNH